MKALTTSQLVHLLLSKGLKTDQAIKITEPNDYCANQLIFSEHSDGKSYVGLFFQKDGSLVSNRTCLYSSKKSNEKQKIVELILKSI